MQYIRFKCEIQPEKTFFMSRKSGRSNPDRMSSFYVLTVGAVRPVRDEISATVSAKVIKSAKVS